MLAGQALKAIFKLKSNLLKFPGITIQHKFDLFNKFILPILYYGVKVWGLNEGTRSCTFLKKVLEGRGETQNNFVYGELGRTSLNQDKLLMLLVIGLILSMLKYVFFNV